jgi:hypothetical protein
MHMNFKDNPHRHSWSFYVKTVDGYDSFITFTDDYSWFDYIYPIKKEQKRWINLRYLRLKLKINTI